ncbi:MAG TPA: hypothetical protein VGM76_07870 [Lacipirellulaceae bacterium]|jgi:hypothetical protein
MAPIIGCGAPERPKTIPLDGHVTIDGKAPGEDGKIYFTPTAAADGYSKRPASGSYNPEGHYRVMSWTPDDGLVPGHYTVSVVPNEPDKTAIPAKYQQSASSGLELDVPVDKGKIEFDINVVTK